MSVEVVAWNLQGRLGDPEYSQRIIDAVLQSDADVLALTNPYDDEALEFSTVYTAKERMTDNHLEIEELGGGAHATRLLVINRRPAAPARHIKTAKGQMALLWPTYNPFDRVVLNVAALHADGLTRHTRSQQVRKLLKTAPEIDIIAGNVSAIQASGARNIALNGLHRLHDHFYNEQARATHPSLRQMGALLARGASVSYDLASHGHPLRIFHDVNAHHQPTDGFVQADHLLFRPLNEEFRTYTLIAEEFQTRALLPGFRASRVVFSTDI